MAAVFRSTVLLVVLTAGGGCAAENRADSYDVPAPSAPTLSYLRTEVRRYDSESGAYELDVDVFELCNQTGIEFFYFNSGPAWRLGVTQVQRDGRWYGVLPIINGDSGFGLQNLLPGQTIEIADRSLAERSRYRIGLNSYATFEAVTVKSQVYEPPDLFVPGHSERVSKSESGFPHLASED